MANKEKVVEKATEKEIVEIMPDDFSEKGIKQAIKEKKMLDYLDSEGKEAKLLNEIVDEEIEAEMKKLNLKK